MPYDKNRKYRINNAYNRTLVNKYAQTAKNVKKKIRVLTV